MREGVEDAVARAAAAQNAAVQGVGLQVAASERIAAVSLRTLADGAVRAHLAEGVDAADASVARIDASGTGALL